MNEKLVSIIIPAFQAENYIQEAIDSVEQQTYPYWELLIVEDSKVDKTEGIVTDIATRIGRNKVKYFCHKENRGLGATRNTGILNAEGEYLAFLDHDDIWSEDHLETAILALKGCDLAYSLVTKFHYKSKANLGYLGPSESELSIFLESLYKRNFVLPSAVVMRKEIIEKVGLFDTNKRIRYCEDHDYFFRCALKKIRFKYLEKSTCFYRKMDPKAATTDNSMMKENQLYFYKKYRKSSFLPLGLANRVILKRYIFLANVCRKENYIKSFKYRILVYLVKLFSFEHIILKIRKIFKNENINSST